MSKFLLIIALFLCTFGAFAQEQVPTSGDKPTEIFFEKPPKALWKEKLRYGGNLWLGFIGAFYLDASPMVGYEITNKGTLAGISGTFIFQGTVNRNSVNNSNNSVYGARVFVRQSLYKKIFAHAEYEFINARADQFYSYTPSSNPVNIKKKWGGSPLIGAGFYQGGSGVSHKGSYISVMYNLGYPNNGFISPQSILGSDNPITLRYGFLF